MSVHPEPVSTRPPPLPGPAVLAQQWRDVTFVHWAVEPAAVQCFLPPGVTVDEIDGRTYVGLVAFRMVGVGLARGPVLPAFPETNVRLYSVDGAGRRGVVFLSLDADQALVVAAGRAGFGLPYRLARMRFRVDGASRTYTARLRRRGPAVLSRLRVRVGARELNGPLAAFLTARWRLHARHLGRTWCLPNSHEPWPLLAAEVTGFEGGLLASVGLPELDGREPDHVAFSPGVGAVFAPPHRADP